MVGAHVAHGALEALAAREVEVVEEQRAVVAAQLGAQRDDRRVGRPVRRLQGGVEATLGVVRAEEEGRGRRPSSRFRLDLYRR